MCYHGIVWDAWRRVLFIGPGGYSDRGMDGALLVEQADIDDASRVDPVEGCTLSEWVAGKFGIRHVVRAHVLMVRASRVCETHHV